MDTVRIVLTCPECGDTHWIRKEDGSFDCLSCGASCTPESMSATVEPIEYGC